MFDFFFQRQPDFFFIYFLVSLSPDFKFWYNLKYEKLRFYSHVFWTCYIVKKSNFYKRQKFKLMEVQKLFWKIFFCFLKKFKIITATRQQKERIWKLSWGFFKLYFMFTWLRKFATAW